MTGPEDPRGPLDEPERKRTFLFGDDGRRIDRVVDDPPPVEWPLRFRPGAYRQSDSLGAEGPISEAVAAWHAGWSRAATEQEIARGVEISREQWAELGRLVGAPPDMTDAGALLEFVRAGRHEPVKTLLLRWTADEVCEIYLHGTEVTEATYDALGWEGLRLVVETARTIAERLGIPVVVEGVPGC